MKSINNIDKCSKCKYFKRLHTRNNETRNYEATIYGLCKKRQRVFAEKYYCSSYEE